MEAEAPSYEGTERPPTEEEAQEDRRSGQEPEPRSGAPSPQGHSVRVGEHRNDPVDLYYELHGHGPHKVLLVMGFATSCRAWMPTVEPLVERYGDEFELCIFDNRGCGRSSCPDSKFSTSVLAADARDLLDHLQWDKVHVVGISMGGMISQELALMLLPAKRLLSLALAVTHAGGLYGLAPLGGVFGMLGGMLKKTPEERAEPLMKVIYSQSFLDSPCKFDPSKTWHQYCKESYIERVRSEPVMSMKGLAGHIRCVTTHRVDNKRLGQLRESGVPIVIMTGTVDPLVRPKNSYLLAQELNPAEFHVWEGAGHAINVECLDNFIEVITRNFRRGAKWYHSQTGDDNETTEDVGQEPAQLNSEQ